MSDRPGRVVVIGVGNRLLRDDGVGVHVVESLARLVEHDPEAMPARTRLVDGGTLGIDLLRHLEGAAALVLVDALDLGLAPGTVRVLRGEQLDAAGRRAEWSRRGGLDELLSVASLLGVLPARVVLVGVQAGEIAAGLALSRTVEAALPAAVEVTRRETCKLAAHGAAHTGDRSVAVGAGVREGAMP